MGPVLILEFAQLTLQLSVSATCVGLRVLKIKELLRGRRLPGEQTVSQLFIGGEKMHRPLSGLDYDDLSR